MRFEPIPAERFAEFHDSFLGDTLATFEVCDHCGGACEYNKVGTLMPGEREYMAEAAGLSVEEFSERYLDILVMDDGMELDVLRLINGCPFLDRVTYKCNCREYKVVLCEIYPVVFHVQEGDVHFSIDDWCPLSDTLPFRRYFQELGVSAIKRLQVPVEWYQHVARYDDLYFDYEALQASGRDPSKPHTFTLAELLRFQRTGQEHDPKERFHPFPSKVYRVPSVSTIAAKGGAPADPRSGRRTGSRPLLPLIREK
jgi:Fe-S-cluster containining protein